MGHDADTGGQIKYVRELAEALDHHDNVQKVDLFTRLIADKNISDDYAQPIEKISDKCSIIRIQCGGRKYMRKELLWPHLDEYIDKTIKYIKRQKRIPDIVHGHYPDGGFVASQLSEIFGVAFIYTGHSLGRSKLSRLLNEGMAEKEIIKKYKIDHRIEVEEDVLKKANLIVVSTSQEIEGQYGQYLNKHLAKYKVLPPGLDINKFYPYYHDAISESEKSEAEKYAQASILEELHRFFKYPDKPLILSLCRPDKRKNIAGLIKAFGEDLELQSMSNLAVFAGIRKDINEMEDNERDVLTEMLLLMDKYDLYGKMAIPKKHDFEYEVPELYRIAADKRGVFVNSALTEPFGITLIEAAACGLPIIAPKDGGPLDIIKNCQCGVLVDTTNANEIATAAKHIMSNHEKWKDFSKNGILSIRKYYTWESHASAYMNEIENLFEKVEASQMQVAIPSDPIGRRLAKLNYFLISDIDNTLIGDENPQLEELLQQLRRHKDQIGFGIATGRTVESAQRQLKKFSVKAPDVIISSVGAEIYYGPEIQYDRGWDTHISAEWDRDKILSLLKKLRFLTYQEESTQRRFKISYYMRPLKNRLVTIHKLLSSNKCRYNLIYSHDKYLDILPYRASKGKALRYISYKWEIPLSNFLVCGDSGNDEEMLRGEPKAIVVGNYSSELEKLKKLRNIYFAKQNYAGGILEGIHHFKFLKP
jgi:sucrose-phosphate synthase